VGFFAAHCRIDAAGCFHASSALHPEKTKRAPMLDQGEIISIRLQMWHAFPSRERLR
jgi:hypothetical protein